MNVGFDPGSKTLDYCKKNGYKVCEENLDGGTVRFRLNLPQYELNYNKFVPYIGGNYYYSPLLNTFSDGVLCLQRFFKKDDQEFLNSIFNTRFEVGDCNMNDKTLWYHHMFYCGGSAIAAMEHFKKWEETGKIDLDTAVYYFFSTSFNFQLTSAISAYYFSSPDCDRVTFQEFTSSFYENWEKTGKISLIPIIEIDLD